MWQAWVNGAIGFWLIVSCLINGLHAQWNYIIAGLVMAVMGLWLAKIWESLVTGILGVWLLVSGIILTAVMHPVNMFVVGIVAAILSFWENGTVDHKAKVA